MSISLLPERPLVVSPTLAATIGLEEAVMLHVFSELIQSRQTTKRPAKASLDWIELSNTELQQKFPFWAPVDIKRVQSSLQNLGLILLDPNNEDVESNFIAIDESLEVAQTKDTPAQAAKLAAKTASGQGTAVLIPPNWQPDDNWLQQCKQHNIPEPFILGLVSEFVNYWRDRGQARFSWGNAFYKHVLKEWRSEQNRKGVYELATAMSEVWRPSEDALGILVNASVNPEFIEDAIPEFVLYWRERGAVHGAWNTKFIEHIRRQWAKFSASFGLDDTPRTISEDWHPSADCYEILQLAEIDEQYAQSKIAEFVMYWKDSQQVKSSWNTVFLQFIKQDWARQLKQLEGADINHAEDQSLVGSNQQKVKERFEQIADRSWAD